MGNGSLWSNVEFEKGVTSHSNNRTSSQKSFISIWKHTNSSNKGVFSLMIFLQLWWPIEIEFSQACYFVVMMGYTKWEDLSLTILANVYFPFKLKKSQGPSPTVLSNLDLKLKKSQGVSPAVLSNLDLKLKKSQVVSPAVLPNEGKLMNFFLTRGSKSSSFIKFGLN